MGNRHLQITDRIEIEKGIDRGDTYEEIGKLIGYSKATISKEISRNINKGSCGTGFFYSAVSAQAKADKNSKKSRKKLKLIANKELGQYIVKKLKDFTPQQISGIINAGYVTEFSNYRVCHETIYSFIYNPINSKLKLWKFLEGYHIKRRLKRNKRQKGVMINNKKSIDIRPATVDERVEFGHFEGDSVVGKRGTKVNIHTQVERVSRRFFATKVCDATAQETLNATIKTLGQIKFLVKSITYDNGVEFAKHEEMSKILNTDIYFAHPYHSWERGSNENRNRQLRKYFPKGTDFSKVTQAQIDVVVEKINNTPLKVLGYKTPNQVWTELVSKIALAA